MNPICVDCGLETKISSARTTAIVMGTKSRTAEPVPQELHTVNSYRCTLCGRQFISKLDSDSLYGYAGQAGFDAEYRRVTLMRADYVKVYEYERQSPEYVGDSAVIEIPFSEDQLAAILALIDGNDLDAQIIADLDEVHNKIAAR